MHARTSCGLPSRARRAPALSFTQVIPPEGWKPDCVLDQVDQTRRFKTKRQELHKLQQGRGIDDGTRHDQFSYRKYADDFARDFYASHPDVLAEAKRLEVRRCLRHHTLPPAPPSFPSFSAPHLLPPSPPLPFCPFPHLAPPLPTPADRRGHGRVGRQGGGARALLLECH